MVAGISKQKENHHDKKQIVLELGCGIEPKIWNYFKRDPRYKVRSFDHLSCHANVEERDISHLPIKNYSVDYVVLSLAMWGTNYEDYIIEAYRVLHSNGRLYIGEATKKWTHDITEEEPEHRTAQRLIDLLERNGFNIVAVSYSHRTLTTNKEV